MKRQNWYDSDSDSDSVMGSSPESEGGGKINEIKIKPKSGILFDDNGNELGGHVKEVYVEDIGVVKDGVYDADAHRAYIRTRRMSTPSAKSVHDRKVTQRQREKEETKKKVKVKKRQHEIDRRKRVSPSDKRKPRPPPLSHPTRKYQPKIKTKRESKIIHRNTYNKPRVNSVVRDGYIEKTPTDKSIRRDFEEFNKQNTAVGITKRLEVRNKTKTELKNRLTSVTSRMSATRRKIECLQTEKITTINCVDISNGYYLIKHHLLHKTRDKNDAFSSKNLTKVGSTYTFDNFWLFSYKYERKLPNPLICQSLIGGIAKHGTRENRPVVTIKVQRMSTEHYEKVSGPVYTDIIVSCVLEQLSKTVPSFISTYDYWISVKTNASSGEEYYAAYALCEYAGDLFMDYCTGNTENVTPQQKQTIIKSVLLQVLFSLYVATKEMEFSHGNIGERIMIKTNTTGKDSYIEIKDQVFCVGTIIGKIVDYSSATIKVKNDRTTNDKVYVGTPEGSNTEEPHKHTVCSFFDIKVIANALEECLLKGVTPRNDWDFQVSAFCKTLLAVGTMDDFLKSFTSPFFDTLVVKGKIPNSESKIWGVEGLIKPTKRSRDNKVDESVDTGGLHTTEPRTKIRKSKGKKNDNVSRKPFKHVLPRQPPKKTPSVELNMDEREVKQVNQKIKGMEIGLKLLEEDFKKREVVHNSSFVDNDNDGDEGTMNMLEYNIIWSKLKTDRLKLRLLGNYTINNISPNTPILELLRQPIPKTPSIELNMDEREVEQVEQELKGLEVELKLLEEEFKKREAVYNSYDSDLDDNDSDDDEGIMNMLTYSIAWVKLKMDQLKLRLMGNFTLSNTV